MATAKKSMAAAVEQAPPADPKIEAVRQRDSGAVEPEYGLCSLNPNTALF